MLQALELAKALEGGALTPARLVDQIEDAIAEREPAVHAFAHLDIPALREAAAYPASGPLRGLPVAFKDIIDTARLPTEYGSPIYRGWRPRADATIVAMTEAAGGLLLGKAATTEFAFLEPARTTNPHDRARTPGGSSSGSAAGVAAGMMPLAFGTQTGGSVIRPAAYCGVSAVKTSFRLLPMVGVKAGAWTLDTLGLFGARTADVAFGLEAITGRPLRVDGRTPAAPRIGVCRMPFAGTPEPEAEQALEVAIKAAERAGATLVDVEMPAEFAAAHEAHPILYDYEGAHALAWEIRAHSDLLSPVLKRHFASPRPISFAAYDGARRVANQARRCSRQWFGDFDALLTYSAPGPAPDRKTTGNAIYNRLFTLLGTPCVNVPVPSTVGVLPLGVQVVCAFGRDAEALTAAHFVETALRKAK